jgi:propionyl-CoA carboxylase beta chain
MTEKNSQMYITGPAVVKSVTGEVISSADLGGAAIHSATSGVAHFVYSDDLSCLNGVRQLLGYLPQNNEETPMVIEGNRKDNCVALKDIVPVDSKKPYDVRNVIRSFVDENSFFEIQERFARNIVIGFGRLAGRTVGFVANQPNQLAGALDIDASDKAARFIRFCDCFNIPLVAIEDVPGFLPGVNQEHHGIIRHGAKIVYAFAEATVPKVTLITRKAYGGAYIVMNSKCIGADVNLAYPTAEIAVMGAEGACNILYRKR